MKNEIEKLFENCHSNQDAPLMGCVYNPLCCTCRNLVEPDNPFNPLSCKVYGKLPNEIYLANQAPCEHYISNK